MCWLLIEFSQGVHKKYKENSEENMWILGLKALTDIVSHLSEACEVFIRLLW